MRFFEYLAYKSLNKLAYVLGNLDHSFSTKTLPSASCFNRILSQLLLSDSDLLLGRIGATESSLLYRYLTNKSLDNCFLSKDLRHSPGIYPPSEYKLIADKYINALSDYMFLGDWPTVGQSKIKEFLHKQNSAPIYFDLEYLNPLHLSFKFNLKPDQLWLRTLETLNILVISPFEQSFRSSKTRDISSFENALLPSINFTCIKPPVTFGSYQGSFSFLDNLFRCCAEINLECFKNKYDLALVSAGGYGFLIAHHIYMNTDISKVLHVGGVLQLYFGLIGKRWLSPPYSDVYRDYASLIDWSRPTSEESSIGKDVEGGCYT